VPNVPPSDLTPESSDQHGPAYRGQPAIDVAAAVAALDAMEIGSGWEVARELRAAHKKGVRSLELSQQYRHDYNRSFRNLIVGRIGEDLFVEHCLKPLQRHGFTIVDERDDHSKRDFVLEQTVTGADGEPSTLRLPINVKVVATRFAQAKRFVGLEPDDCVPLKMVSVMSAVQNEPNLVFVHLIEHTLRQRVDAYMSRLSGHEALAWQLLSAYGGKGVEAAQDEYVKTLFSKESPHAANLLALSAGAKGFQVISAQDALWVHNTIPKRTPQSFGHGVGGTPMVHVSVELEMLPWKDLATQLRRVGVAGVVKSINNGGLRPSPGNDVQLAA
jgi:hypothetical protein